MAWHRLGTVSVTNGSTTVTGVSTGFAANTRIGDAFIGPDGRQYELQNVASDTVISVLPAYLGPTASVQPYAVVPVQGYQKGLADQVRDWTNQYGQKMADLGTTGNYDVLPVAKGGTGSNSAAAARTALGVDVTMASAVLDPQTAGGLMSRTVVSGFDVFKYANGQCIIQGPISTAASVPANTDFTISAAIPSVFATGNTALMATLYPSAGNDFSIKNTQAPSTTAFVFGRNGATAQTFSGNILAIGRWK
ncbi:MULTISPECIES: hypothetical protein [unclassified Pseudomonas]|uniref:hypothetical protein n=1 Tax=unclassified Pseudomonas TaxID=196821 RepID=UPI0011AFD040|nr:MULTISPECIES: hypothetical protein [unclassified Pseudomonas]